MMSTMTCGLCKGALKDPMRTINCSHFFCRGCLGEIGGHSKCPTCEKELPPSGIRLDTTLATLMRVVQENDDDNKKPLKVEPSEEEIERIAFVLEYFPVPCSLELQNDDDYDPVKADQEEEKKDILLSQSPKETKPEAENTPEEFEKEKSPKGQVFVNSTPSIFRRYFRCPGSVTVATIQRLLRTKFVGSENYTIPFVHSQLAGEITPEMTFSELAKITGWQKTRPLRLMFTLIPNKEPPPSLEPEPMPCLEAEDPTPQEQITPPMPVPSTSYAMPPTKMPMMEPMRGGPPPKRRRTSDPKPPTMPPGPSQPHMQQPRPMIMPSAAATQLGRPLFLTPQAYQQYMQFQRLQQAQQAHMMIDPRIQAAQYVQGVPVSNTTNPGNLFPVQTIQGATIVRTPNQFHQRQMPTGRIAQVIPIPVRTTAQETKAIPQMAPDLKEKALPPFRHEVSTFPIAKPPPNSPLAAALAAKPKDSPQPPQPTLTKPVASPSSNPPSLPTSISTPPTPSLPSLSPAPLIRPMIPQMIAPILSNPSISSTPVLPKPLTPVPQPSTSSNVEVKSPPPKLSVPSPVATPVVIPVPTTTASPNISTTTPVAPTTPVTSPGVPNGMGIDIGTMSKMKGQRLGLTIMETLKTARQAEAQKSTNTTHISPLVAPPSN